MVNDFPENIMQLLRLRHGLNRFDKDNDESIKKMSKSSAFKDVLCWNGIIGFDNVIKGYIKDIYEVDLDTFRNNKGLPYFSGKTDKNNHQINSGDIVGVNGMIGCFTVVFDCCAFLLRHNDGKYDDRPIGFIESHNLTKIGSVYD